jgi:hypothetical protein
MDRKSLILGIALACVSMPAPCSAQDLFYPGPVVVEDIEVGVDIGDEASISAAYSLTNHAESAERVILSVPEIQAEILDGAEPVEDGISFGPGETKTITVRYSVSVLGEVVHSIAFTPALMFDGLWHPEPAAHVHVTVWLPEGTPTVLDASVDLQVQSTQDSGRVAYTWEAFNFYPTSIMLIWSALPYQLSVEKTASPTRITEPGQTIRIEIVVENHGGEPVSDLQLMDEFVRSEFEGVEPEGQFWIPDTDFSDPHLYWVVQIGALQPGERQSLAYVLRYVGDTSLIHTIELEPCRVTAGGALVGVSNRVPLYQRVGVTVDRETEVPDRQEIVPTGLFLIGALGAALGIGLIVTGVVLARRRR